MKSFINEKPKFSLKDELFNEKSLNKLAKEIKSVYKSFNDKEFIKYNLKAFPKLKLKERIEFICDSFNVYINADFKKCVSIILKSLPKELDPTLSDNDFGDFIHSSHSLYIAKFGCNKKNLTFSLNALKEITKRFSSEFAIRFFINSYPTETLSFLKKCAKDKNYHVRRLASEGSRPTLPWAQKISINYNETLSILDKLYSDNTRFVTRSVANHLNDISKIDPKFVIQTLKKWKKENKQNDLEFKFILKHSLRSLVNLGHKDALKLIKIYKPVIQIKNFKLKNKNVKIGENLEFEFYIESKLNKSQNLLIDYIIYFKKANNKYNSKTFKIKKFCLEKNTSAKIKKKHYFKVMSTKKLYTGMHSIGLQINGELFNKKDFNLKND